MASFLVAYGTREGQTRKVAERIRDAIEGHGHTATTVGASEAAELSLSGFDAVVVGSDIHYEKHHPGVREFLAGAEDELRRLPTAFFQVSMSSAVDDEERRAEAARYADELLEETGWNPDRVGFFGGALRYSKYGFLKRLMMKRIAKEATGDVDTSRDYEYTDWDAVDGFARGFVSFVERRSE
jgi:menaquinone-dependent protoporphyrinogen oxidase